VSIAEENWSGISLFWDHNPDTQEVVIALQGPVVHLRNFASPSDLMESFLMAVRSAGADLGQTDSIRAKIDADGTFKLQWVGKVQSQPDIIPGVMRTLSLDLGIREL
jgi:hypothetical protein